MFSFVNNIGVLRLFFVLPSGRILTQNILLCQKNTLFPGKYSFVYYNLPYFVNFEIMFDFFRNLCQNIAVILIREDSFESRKHFKNSNRN